MIRVTFRKNAGIISMYRDGNSMERGFWNTWCIHIGLAREDWTWGYDEDYYDGPLPMFGCGPLFLVTWGA